MFFSRILSIHLILLIVICWQKLNYKVVIVHNVIYNDNNHHLLRTDNTIFLQYNFVFVSGFTYTLC